MGYYIFSFGIDTPKVKAAMGSKNLRLLDEIVETETFENYAEQDFKGHTTTEQALEHIIYGKPYNKKSGHAYWYAFIALCAHLGEEMPATHEINVGYETDLINEYLESDFGIKTNIEELLLNNSETFGLPKVQDWPLAGLLNKTQLTQLKDTFATVEITDELLQDLADDDQEKEMAYDTIKQTKQNILYCLQHNLELISFCH
jgi:hypothetical protein